MTYSESALSLRYLSPSTLPRLEDRLPYIYIEFAKIRQTDTGVIVAFNTGEIAEIPVANLAFIILGPGTSISTTAAQTAFGSGTSLIFSGSYGIGGYIVGTPLTGSAKHMIAQAQLISNPEARIDAAKFLYRYRYPALDFTAPSLTVLRGLEGRAMRNAYQTLCRKHRLTNWKRDTMATDGVNICLNIANSILYGAAVSVCSALAVSPALGIIHSGRPYSFLYDLADLYKVDIALPIAFRIGTSKDTSSQYVRLEMRKKITTQKILQSMTEVTLELLKPFLENGAEDVLLADSGFVPGMVNYGDI